MSWAERLEKIKSETPLGQKCLKGLKPPNQTLDTLDTPAQSVFQKNKSQRCAYRFRLQCNEGGGIYLTDAPTLDAARNELLQQYGDRLALVAQTRTTN